jgi:K+-transporting ATPase ATPase A chain
MTLNGYVQLGLYLIVLLVLAKPLGWYMARVYEGLPVGLDRVLGPLERLIYRLCGVRAERPEAEMTWKTYAIAMLLFNLFGFLALYALQRIQGALPLNPQGLGAVTPDSSFNTAASFASNTNWQGYGVARLWRRNHHELPDADAGHDGAELRVGGVRHGDAGGAYPRLSAAHGADHR